jgi:hypothetical protein
VEKVEMVEPAVTAVVNVEMVVKVETVEQVANELLWEKGVYLHLLFRHLTTMEMA